MKKMIVAAGIFAGLTAGASGVAGAQDCSYDGSCTGGTVPLVEPEELPAVVESAGLPGIEVKGKQQLPVTGGDAAGLAAIGATLVAGGGVLVWRSRAAIEA